MRESVVSRYARVSRTCTVFKYPVFVRKRFNVRAHLPLVRKSEVKWREQKKGLEKNQNEVARTKKGLESAWRDLKQPGIPD